MNPRRNSHLAPGVLAAFAVVLLSVCAARAGAAPVFGFREDWLGTSTNGWLGGSASGLDITNPGTGGTLGAGDGYLNLALAEAGNFGARSTGAEYVGNWPAAGIEQVRLSLNDVGAPNTFEIHFCIGNSSNFWQYNAGFVPLNNVWKEFFVDVTDPNNFTQIIGSGTYAQAVQFADRILLRNDSAPFIQTPNPTNGDLGIDRVILTAVVTPTLATTWGRIKQLYR